MRIDNPTPPITTETVRREVRGLSAVYAVKPVAERERGAQQDAPSQRQPEPAAPDRPEQRSYGPDRRKLCRRVSKQAVLIELRSGVDRRKVDQRDGDVRTHIDEVV